MKGEDAMGKTANYGLPKWEKSDFIKMDDFNAAFGKIDETLKANADAVAAKAEAETVTAIAQALGSGGQNCRIAWGSYTGNGKYGSANPTSLTFDFKPMVVFITSDDHARNNLGQMIRPSSYGSACSGGAIRLTWSDHGVSWYTTEAVNANSHQNNSNDYTYQYLAIGY